MSEKKNGQAAAIKRKGLPLLVPGMTPDDVREQVLLKKPRDMERHLDGLHKTGLE